MNNIKELEKNISELYDNCSQPWIDVWGPDLHHGYYENDIKGTDAQQHLIKKLLEFSNPSLNNNSIILDVGCGVGGSSRYMAKKYNIPVYGITLSQKQVEIANTLSQKDSINYLTHFSVDNVLYSKFDNNNFDFIWSCESAEHMPDKQLFIKETHRMLKPKGKLLVATWCTRDSKSLNSIDKFILFMATKCYANSITWVDQSAYDNNLYTNIKYDDWTNHVKKFWLEVILSAFSVKGIKALYNGGFHMIKGAIGILFMIMGFYMGTMKYIVFVAEK